jgi:hypothetical protein
MSLKELGKDYYCDVDEMKDLPCEWGLWWRRGPISNQETFKIDPYSRNLT